MLQGAYKTYVHIKVGMWYVGYPIVRFTDSFKHENPILGVHL